MDRSVFHVITFYEFRRFPERELLDMKERLKELMERLGVKGTIILAQEGFNASLGGTPDSIETFIAAAGSVFGAAIRPKSSFHLEYPFRRIEVKIKPEIVSLKKEVDISAGAGTHVKPGDWNEIIRDPEVVLLDARNDYEFKNGTFRGAVNPRTAKFSELPEFVANNLDPERNKKIAMFCTGGIRCEKFVPYMKNLGFEQVFQLEGGILKYLEVTAPEESLWSGECFVFDDRVTLDHSLQKGSEPDRSLEPIS